MELCRRHGFSEASHYLWRDRFGGGLEERLGRQFSDRLQTGGCVSLRLVLPDDQAHRREGQHAHTKASDRAPSGCLCSHP